MHAIDIVNPKVSTIEVVCIYHKSKYHLPYSLASLVYLVSPLETPPVLYAWKDLVVYWYLSGDPESPDKLLYPEASLSPGLKAVLDGVPNFPSWLGVC